MTFTFGGVNPVTDDIDLEGNDLTDSTQDTVDTDKNIRVTGSSALSYGRNNGTLGSKSQAIGIGAGGQNKFTTSTGRDAASNSVGRFVTTTGVGAGRNNTGNRATITGVGAGRDTTGDKASLIGVDAGRNNIGDKASLIGVDAGRSNTGLKVSATGVAAALDNTGNRTTVTGVDAARGDGLTDSTTMGDDNIGIGVSAIRNNQASGLIAIGQEAGINAQTDDQLIITDRNGNRRMVMDLTNGDLKIDGSLTQNANL